MQAVLLELHPELSDGLKAAIRRDYGMQDNQNEIVLTERGALIWLLCNQWLVDKSEGINEGRYYNFLLKNRSMLKDYL